MRSVDPAAAHGRTLQLTPGDLLRVALAAEAAERRPDRRAEVSRGHIRPNAVGKASEALRGRKAESTDRPSRERWLKARTRGAAVGVSLRSDMQRNIQTELNLSSTPAGEAREAGREEIESLRAANDPESPASTNRLMEEVCEREN